MARAAHGVFQVRINLDLKIRIWILINIASRDAWYLKQLLADCLVIVLHGLPVNDAGTVYGLSNNGNTWIVSTVMQSLSSNY